MAILKAPIKYPEPPRKSFGFLVFHERGPRSTWYVVRTITPEEMKTETEAVGDEELWEPPARKLCC